MNNQRRISVPHQAPKKHVSFKYSSVLNITRKYKSQPKSTLETPKKTFCPNTQTNDHSDDTNTCPQRRLVSSTKCVTNSGHHCKPCHLKFHLHVPNFLKFHHHHPHNNQVQPEVKCEPNEVNTEQELSVSQNNLSLKDKYETIRSVAANGLISKTIAFNLKTGFTQTNTYDKTPTSTEYKNYTSGQRRRIFSKYGHGQGRMNLASNGQSFETTKLSRWDEADELSEGLFVYM